MRRQNNFNSGVFFAVTHLVSNESEFRLSNKTISIIEQLIAFFKNPENETKHETPSGVCPNCWGIQEYDSEIRELYQDQQIDVNNGQDHYDFIKKVVVIKIEGIKLKKGNNGLVCNSCKPG